MIDPASLTADDVGRSVIYRPLLGKGAEVGEITSWNEQYVFVRYGLGGGIATHPEDLEWQFPDDEVEAT